MVLWLEVRMALGAVTTGVTVWLPVTAIELAGAACGRPVDITLLPVSPPPWACALLVPVPLLALYGAVVGLGELVTAIARRLLGPSPAERLAALEERTEQLLERTRIARELHDSIGHALTVAVVQAGAAMAAWRPRVHRPGAARHRGHRPGRPGGPGNACSARRARRGAPRAADRR